MGKKVRQALNPFLPLPWERDRGRGGRHRPSRSTRRYSAFPLIRPFGAPSPRGRRGSRRDRRDAFPPHSWGGGPVKRGRGRRLSGGMLELVCAAFWRCARPFDPSFAKAKKGPLPHARGEERAGGRRYSALARAAFLAPAARVSNTNSEVEPDMRSTWVGRLLEISTRSGLPSLITFWPPIHQLLVEE